MLDSRVTEASSSHVVISIMPAQVFDDSAMNSPDVCCEFLSFICSSGVLLNFCSPLLQQCHHSEKDFGAGTVSWRFLRHVLAGPGMFDSAGVWNVSKQLVANSCIFDVATLLAV